MPSLMLTGGTPYMLRRKKTAYYKNVQVVETLTKVWRCYGTSIIFMGNPANLYYYAAPFATGGSFLYVSKNGIGYAAATLADLTTSEVMVVEINEDQVLLDKEMTLARFNANDLVETVEVIKTLTVPGTADEYDFSAPSLQNYILKKGDTSYILRRKP